MKKKQVTKHTISKKYTRATKPFIPSQGFIIITTCVAVFLAAFIVFDKHAVRQQVQGIQIMRGMFAEATITLPPVSGAVAYNIYYGERASKGFIHAVRKIPANMTSYTIQYLKNNTAYSYQVAALNAQGREFYFSPVTSMNTIRGM